MMKTYSASTPRSFCRAWVEIAVPDEDVSGIPESMLEGLYPDVASFGPAMSEIKKVKLLLSQRFEREAMFTYNPFAYKHRNTAMTLRGVFAQDFGPLSSLIGGHACEVPEGEGFRDGTSNRDKMFQLLAISLTIKKLTGLHNGLHSYADEVLTDWNEAMTKEGFPENTLLLSEVSS